jgi:hypothetical protein
MTYLTAGRQYGLQNAKKNCILYISRDKNTGGHETPVPDTPYILASKTASSAYAVQITVSS